MSSVRAKRRETRLGKEGGPDWWMRGPCIGVLILVVRPSPSSRQVLEEREHRRSGVRRVDSTAFARRQLAARSTAPRTADKDTRVISAPCQPNSVLRSRVRRLLMRNVEAVKHGRAGRSSAG